MIMTRTIYILVNTTINSKYIFNTTSIFTHQVFCKFWKWYGIELFSQDVVIIWSTSVKYFLILTCITQYCTILSGVWTQTAICELIPEWNLFFKCKKILCLSFVEWNFDTTARILEVSEFYRLRSVVQSETRKFLCIFLYLLMDICLFLLLLKNSKFWFGLAMWNTGQKLRIFNCKWI